MINLLMLLVAFANFQEVDIGLASVFNDKIFACPKSTYKKTGLPICAHRTLPCGTILNVERIDTEQTAKCVVADRGPYGCCLPAHINTRACGRGSKWINGRNFVRKKIPMKSAAWRGILDMSRPLAKLLNVKNRLVPVVIYTDFANSEISSITPDEIDDPKLERKSNNIDALMLLEMTKSDEITAHTNKNNNR